MHSAELLADQNCLATGLLDGFLRGLRELVRVNGNRSSQLAVVEHLDQAALLAQQAKRDDRVEGELGLRSSRQNLSDAIKSEHRVLDAEDVVEAALGQAAVQRHLAALEAAHQRRAGARALPLVAAGGCLAHGRT